MQNAIDHRARIDGWDPTQILEWLNQQEKYQGKVPTLRTIQRRVRLVTPEDRSGDWGLGDSEPDDARLVLETLAAMVLRSEGRISRFSRTLAEWIIRVRRASSDLGGEGAYLLASEYLQLSEAKLPTRDLDTLLSLAPWKNQESKDRYNQALKDGWIAESKSVMWIRQTVRMARNQDWADEHLRDQSVPSSASPEQENEDSNG